MEFSFFLLRIWLSLAAVLAIGPTTPGGQIRQEQHARLRAALAADDLASVENQLREMGRSAPEAFARNNYDLSLIHISEPTRLLSISYAVFCLKKKKKKT